MDPIAQQWLGKILDEYVGEWVPAVLSEHGVELSPVVSPEPRYSIAGIIGFVGDLSGTLLVGTGPDLLCACHPMRQSVPRVPMRMQLDWVGEIANLITGRLKLRLKNHGIEFDFSPPISLAGDRLKHMASGHRQPHRSAFRCVHGELGVWIDAEMDEAAATNPSFFTEVTLGGGPEGTLLLF